MFNNRDSTEKIAYQSELLMKSAFDYCLLLEKAITQKLSFNNQSYNDLDAHIASIHGGVMVCKNNSTLTIEYANEGFYSLVGRTQDDMQKKFSNHCIDVIPESERQRVLRRIEQQLEGGNDIVLEFPVALPDGGFIYIIARALLLIADNGDEMLQCVFTDATQQRRAIDVIGTAKEYYEDILNSSPDAMIIMNADMNITFLNKQAAKVIGKSYDYLVGMPCSLCELPICNTDDCGVCKLKNGRKNSSFSLNERDYHVTIAPLKSGDENTGYIEILQDDTLQKITREKLIRKNEQLAISSMRYKVAMDHTSAVMFDYSSETRTIVHSDSAVVKFGVPKTLLNVPESIIKKRIAHDAYETVLLEAYKRIDAGEPVTKHSIILFDSQNKELLVDVTITNIFNENGKIISAIGVMEDVTSCKELQLEKQYRNALTAGNYMIYELNVTQDKILSGNTRWKNMVGERFSLPYSKLIQNIALEFVHENDRERFLSFTSLANIIEENQNNNHQLRLQYRRNDGSGNYIWVENITNIITDANSGDVKVLCQINNINSQKEIEAHKNDELLFYNAMIARSTVIYETNVTQKRFIRGHEKWDGLYGISLDAEYAAIIAKLIKKTVYPPDFAEFNKYFDLKNLTEWFYSGNRELYGEFRCLGDDGEPQWRSCTVHLIQDIQSGDIKAFSYIVDINDRKSKEIELLYSSQHDSVSGLLNRGAFQKNITEFLAENTKNSGIHAFIMFDIDDFKAINDNYGHLFGDAVLSEISRKIRALFREDDVQGRIGGDEFAIFMKNIPDVEVALAKCAEICEATSEVYTKNGKEYTTTASVGVAICPLDGVTFDDLYQNADSALYTSKGNGKNQFTRYTEGIVAKPNVDRQVFGNDLIENKPFGANICEYVFRLLYEASDKQVAIDTVLELVCKHFGFSRGYIFEDTVDGKVKNTFEWCNNGVTKLINLLSCVTYDNLLNVDEKFNELGIFFLDEVDSKICHPFLCDVSSIILFSIQQNGNYSGFVGFDGSDKTQWHNKTNITNLKVVADILGVFIADMRESNAQKVAHYVSELTLASVSCSSYVLDMDTYKLKYISRLMLDAFPTAKIGSTCYKAFWGRETPCEFCEIERIKSGHTDSFSYKKQIEENKMWLKVTGSRQEVDGEKDSLLITAIDITEFM